MQTTIPILNIKKGERYNHSIYGKVKVTSIEQNLDSHIVYFVDSYGYSETQGVTSFKLNTTQL